MINGVPAEKTYPQTLPALPPVTAPSTAPTTLGTSLVKKRLATPIGVFLPSAHQSNML
jgi:hypothetical protein